MSRNGNLGADFNLRSGHSTPHSFDESASLLDNNPALDSQNHSEFPNYGASNSNQRQNDSLPTRLARSASIARKRERRERRKESWRTFSIRSRYYIPVLNWLPEYTWTAFAGDVTAAFTMTSMIVPQSMSYASNLAQIDPVNGLFGAAIPAMVYSVLGTCRQLSVGPEASLSLIMGQAITAFIADEQHAHGELDPADRMKLAMLISTVITFEAGIITFALGLMRLGFLDAVLSRALLRGFVTAVGLVIFVSQLVPILGLERVLADSPIPVESSVDKVFFVLRNLSRTHLLTLAVSGTALATLVLAKMFKGRLFNRRGFKWLAYVPEVLLVVIASTVATGVFNWDLQGLSVLGKVSAGEARVALPFTKSAGYLSKCLGTSTVIAILGYLDSIVGAKDSAARYGYPVSPNRELVAVGAANIAASFVVGTLPGYGSITRSRLAGDTGATTQMTSLLTGAFVLLVSYFLLGFLFFLPKAILATIILVVVFSILAEAPHDVLFFWKMQAWVDGGLMLLTFVLTFFVGVETGIVVSVAVSMVLCIKQSASMRVSILGRVPGTQYYEPLDDDDDDGLLPGEEIPGVLIVRLRDSSLTFANAGALKERLRRLERYGRGRHHPSDRPRRAEASVIIFSLQDTEDIDASALQLLSEVVEAYVARSVLIYWAHVQPAVLARLDKCGILVLSGDASHVQPNVQSALNSLNETMLASSMF
ncbi:hypothetical protein T439DRAFT_320323 [Meredithblackwellia eburnea MCA 4105]